MRHRGTESTEETMETNSRVMPASVLLPTPHPVTSPCISLCLCASVPHSFSSVHQLTQPPRPRMRALSGLAQARFCAFSFGRFPLLICLVAVAGEKGFHLRFGPAPAVKYVPPLVR